MERRGLPFNVILEAGSIETVKHYASQGHGLAIVNSACLTPEDKKVFHLIEFPDEIDHHTDYGVILRQDKYFSSALNTLLTLLGAEVH